MDEAAREATDNLKKVETRLSQANQKLQELGSAGALDARVTQARAVLDDAVMKSQLHAFTGMFFAPYAPVIVRVGASGVFIVEGDNRTAGGLVVAGSFPIGA